MVLCVSQAEDNDSNPLSLGRTLATTRAFHRLPQGAFRLTEIQGETAAFWGWRLEAEQLRRGWRQRNTS